MMVALINEEMARIYWPLKSARGVPDRMIPLSTIRAPAFFTASVYQL
jgi:hypothetical protein